MPVPVPETVTAGRRGGGSWRPRRRGATPRRPSPSRDRAGPGQAEFGTTSALTNKSDQVFTSNQETIRQSSAN